MVVSVSMSVDVDWAASPHSSARPSLSTFSSVTSSPLPSPIHGAVDARSVAPHSHNPPAPVPSLAATAAMSAARERDISHVEENKVRVVQESMLQCQQLTDTMLGILEQFDRKLKALEVSMQPLHRGTVQLINAHKSRQHPHRHTRQTQQRRSCTAAPMGRSRRGRALTPWSLSVRRCGCPLCCHVGLCCFVLHCVCSDIESTLSETDKVIAYVAVATELDDDSSGVVLSSASTMPLSPSAASSSPLNPLSSRHLSLDPSSFLSWLAEVSTALDFFSRHSDYRNSALYVKKLRELQRRALVECANEYERLMTQHCRPVDPSRLQWPLSPDLDLMPHAATQPLVAIAQQMSACGLLSFVGVMVRERSATLRASIKRAIKDEQLNPLRDSEEHKPATDARSQQAGQQQQAAAEVKQDREAEVSRSSTSSSSLHRSQPVSAAAVVKSPATPQHASLAAVSAASHFAGSTLNLHGKASHMSAKEKEKLDERRRHELYRSNTHVIIYHIRLLLGLMGPERELLRRLLSHTTLAEDNNRTEFQRVFADICREAIAYLVRKEDDKLKSWSKVELKAENRLLALIDITQYMHSALPAFYALLQQTPSFAPLADFHQLLLAQLRRQLAEYGQYVTQYEDADKGLAVSGKKRKKDGAVHVLTTEVLMLCRRLADYRNALDSMNRQQVLELADSTPAAREKAERERQQRDRKDKDEAAEFERKRAKGKVSYSQVEAERARERDRERRQTRDQLTASTSNSVYAAIVWQVLQWLEAKLEQQARHLHSRHATLAAIFLVNNLHYIASFISRHAQLPALAHYFALATKHSTADYRAASFDKLLAALPSAAEADTLASSLAAEANSSDRSRKAIKAVFANFNAAFDEQCNTQRSFSVSDAELRHSLRQSSVQLVVPRYRTVFDKLSALSFTTKPTKYCRFTPAVVEQMLHTFFDE